MRIRPIRSAYLEGSHRSWWIYLLATLCCATVARAQCPFDRAATVGEGSTLGSAVAVDASENIYMAGSFSDTVRFGDTSFHTRFDNPEVFLARFGRDLGVQWARSIPGMRHAHRVIADAQGNTYTAGRMADRALVGGTTLIGRGEYDIFLIKHDPDGEPLWGTSAGGAAFDMPYDVAIDADGNIYMTGRFSGVAWFGQQSVTSRGGEDIFIAKYDSAGNPLWARSAGGAWNDHGYALAVDPAGNAYITGLYQSTAWFGADSLYTAMDAALFVAAYDRDGDVRWVWAPSGEYAGAGYGIAAAPNGMIHVTGDFLGEMRVGAETITPYGLSDIFLLTLDSSGVPRWCGHGGGELHDRGNRVVIGPGGDIVVTGGINEEGEGAVRFGEAVLDVPGANIFVARYDANGQLLCVNVGGGEQTESANGVACGPSGDAYIVGSFNFSTSFGDLHLEGNPFPKTTAYIMAVPYDGSPTAVPITSGADEERMLAVIPNPNNGAFSVRSELEGDLELRLADMQGAELWRRSQRHDAGSAVGIDARDLPAGIYVLEASQGGARWRRLVVIR